MQDDPRVRDLLNEAADLPPARRAAYRDAACGRDAGLRAEVESLLRSLDDSDEFLESPTVVPTTAIVGEDPRGGPGELGKIGRIACSSGWARAGWAWSIWPNRPNRSAGRWH